MPSGVKAFVRKIACWMPRSCRSATVVAIAAPGPAITSSGSVPNWLKAPPGTRRSTSASGGVAPLHGNESDDAEVDQGPQRAASEASRRRSAAERPRLVTAADGIAWMTFIRYEKCFIASGSQQEKGTRPARFLIALAYVAAWAPDRDPAWRTLLRCPEARLGRNRACRVDGAGPSGSSASPGCRPGPGDPARTLPALYRPGAR